MTSDNDSISSALFFRVCREHEAPTDHAGLARYTSSTSDTWTNGIIPQERNDTGVASGLLSIIVVMFVLITLNARHCYRLFSNMGADLLSVRRRANAFDDHTADETRTIVLLILQLCICEGIIMTGFLPQGTDLSTPLVTSMTGLMLLFYVIQLAAYCIIGYVFTDHINSIQWRRGFNVSQTLLGMILLIPALVMLFYPAAVTFVLPVAVFIYFLARFSFIYKGFRIFYHNLPSLLYFILYLCALEIIPVILIYSGAQFLGRLFVE